MPSSFYKLKQLVNWQAAKPLSERGYVILFGVFFNPLSPSIKLQILFTDLHMFSYSIIWENLLKDQSKFSYGDHLIHSLNVTS